MTETQEKVYQRQYTHALKCATGAMHSRLQTRNYLNSFFLFTHLEIDKKEILVFIKFIGYLEEKECKKM